MKVYGPYSTKDGRQIITIVENNGKRRMKSYPKYLMEQILGRELDPDLENIHHKDGNFLNNDPSNLEIIDRVKHSSNHALRVVIKSHFKCPMCNKEFTISSKQVHGHIYNRSIGKAGPFCSKHCAGLYGKAIQNGRMTKLKVDKIDNREYYKQGRVFQLDEK